MIDYRFSEARGVTRTSWLDSRHTFSFSDYYDPHYLHFGPLRVINDDVIMPGAGFGFHPHKDMEIITYVLDGQLTHADSLGNSLVMSAGDVQLMSAGTGIEHSEMNQHHYKSVHLLQIWIFPTLKGLSPSYEQKNFMGVRQPHKVTVLASEDGRQGSLTLHQNAEIAVLDLEEWGSFEYSLPSESKVWGHVVRGKILLNDQALKAGDGVGIHHEKVLVLKALEQSEMLFFTFPAERARAFP